MTIYIYNDLGVDPGALCHTINFVKDHSYKRPQLINHHEIIAGTWIEDAALLIMPGGADLGYVNKLNGAGNAAIRDYVQNGGAYLGICAGAYYASKFIEFDIGGKQEISGSRELAFFPGKSIGPHLAQYDYLSYSGARLAPLTLSHEFSDQTAVFYYNGGGYFADAETYDNTKVLAWYQTANAIAMPAIIQMQSGKGQVILSGVHFEYAPELLDSSDLYLAPIIPELYKTNPARKRLVQHLMAGLKAKAL